MQLERSATTATAAITVYGVADTLEQDRTGEIAFSVVNTGTITTDFAIACVPSTGLECIATVPSSVNLGPQREAIVKARVRASSIGTVTVGLAASAGVTSTGSAQVPVIRRAILTAAMPASGRVDRAHCPTTTVSPGGAVQCGDLLYAHTLPGYRSVGRERAVTLLYNSATVAGRSLISVDYRYYPGSGAAEAVRLDVYRPGSPRRLVGRAHYATSSASAELLHARLGLPVLWDSLVASPGADASGAHPLSVHVVRKLQGVWREDIADTMPVRVNIVDRRNSPFGAGWWMAGLEQGQSDGNGVLIAFGDGSSTYFPQPGTTGEAPAGEHSILEPASSGGFTRILPGRRLQVAFGANGRPLAIRDTNPVRNTASYHWTGSQLDSIVDPVGRATRFRYAVPGRIASIHGPRGDSTVLTQSVKAGGTTADLDLITDADNFGTPFQYNGASHMMASSQARATGTVSYDFDPGTATLAFISAPSGVSAPERVTRAWQRVGAAPDPFAATSAAPLGLVAADSATAVISWWRLVDGQQVRDTAWFQVHATGAPTKVSRPGMGLVTIARDSVGQPLRIRTLRGAEAIQLWNADGNLVKAKMRVRVGWADTTTRLDSTRYEYHPVWKSLTKTVTATGDSTRVAYDAYGRVEHVTDPLGRTSHIAYEARGLVKRVTEPHPTQVGVGEPNPTTYLYDSTDTWNLRQILKGEAGPTYEYDATALKPWAVQDAAGNRVEYEFDDIGRTKAITNNPRTWSSGDQSYVGAQATNRTINYHYNDTARTRTMMGPRQLYSREERDAAGRVTRQCFAYDSCGATITYGDGLNPTRQVRRRGDIILQKFDAAGRVTMRTSKRSETATPDDVITYVHDEDGNLTGVNNRYSRISRSYDAWGRLVREGQTIRGYVDTVTTFTGIDFMHDYDASGRRERTYATGAVRCYWCTGGRTDSVLVNGVELMSYTHNRDGTLDEMQHAFWQAASGRWKYQYDREGRPTGLSMPTVGGGRDYSYSYDALDRLTGHGYGVNGGRDRDTILQFDAVGRTLAMRHNNAETRYVYDGLGQLRYNSGGRIPEDSMRYDVAGNIQRMGRWTSEYDVDWNGVRGHLYFRRNLYCKIFYEHDANGNQTRSYWQDEPTCESQPTSMGERVHASDFDPDGRMLHDTTTYWRNEVNGDRVRRKEVREYWYDGLGRRVLQHSKHSRADDNGVTRYFWAGENVAVKVRNDVATATNPDGPDEFWPWISAGNIGLVSQWYIYEPGVDRVLGMLQGGGSTPTHSLYYRDYRGSVVRVTDQNGNNRTAQVAPRYESFGKGVATPDNAEARPGYNGLESPGGLVYMRNRWYDPQSGRFTQQDPIGFAGGINLYGYVGNDPVTFSDPFGLKMCFAQQGRDELVQYAQEATQTTFDLDEGGCATNVKANDDDFTAVGLAFSRLVASSAQHNVMLGAIGSASHVGGGAQPGQPRADGGFDIVISRSDINAYNYPVWGGMFGRECGRGTPTTSGPAIFAHEMGHVYEHSLRGSTGVTLAVALENIVHARERLPERCGH